MSFLNFSTEIFFIKLMMFFKIFICKTFFFLSIKNFMKKKIVEKVFLVFLFWPHIRQVFVKSETPKVIFGSHMGLVDSLVKPDGFMVSLDIKALFPSLPMEKALAYLEKRLSNFSDLPKYTDLSSSEIMSLIQECTSNPWFECEFGVYIQTEGAPMGGPMSCILADLFMEEYEEQINSKSTLLWLT
jgi:hypothetical protein